MSRGQMVKNNTKTENQLTRQIPIFTLYISTPIDTLSFTKHTPTRRSTLCFTSRKENTNLDLAYCHKALLTHQNFRMNLAHQDLNPKSWSNDTDAIYSRILWSNCNNVLFCTMELKKIYYPMFYRVSLLQIFRHNCATTITILEGRDPVLYNSPCKFLSQLICAVAQDMTPRWTFYINKVATFETQWLVGIGRWPNTNDGMIIAEGGKDPVLYNSPYKFLSQLICAVAQDMTPRWTFYINKVATFETQWLVVISRYT